MNSGCICLPMQYETQVSQFCSIRNASATARIGPGVRLHEWVRLQAGRGDDLRITIVNNGPGFVSLYLYKVAFAEPQQVLIQAQPVGPTTVEQPYIYELHGLEPGTYTIGLYCDIDDCSKAQGTLEVFSRGMSN